MARTCGKLTIAVEKYLTLRAAIGKGLPTIPGGASRREFLISSSQVGKWGPSETGAVAVRWMTVCTSATSVYQGRTLPNLPR